MPEISRRTTVGISLCAMPLFFYALFRFSIGVVLPDLSSELGLDPVQAGLFVSLSFGASAVGSGPAGYLSDKVGEKHVLIVGLLMYSSGLLAAMFYSRLELFLILMVFSSLGIGLMVTPVYSMVGRLIPKSRATAMGALVGLYNFGGFVGPALTSALLTTAGWRSPFILIGAFGIGVAILLFFAVRIPATDPSRRNQLQPASSRLALFRQHNILLIATAMFLANLSFAAFISWTPSFMREELSMPAELAGLSFGIAIGIGAVGSVLMGYLFDKIGGKRATIIGGSTSAALSFLLFLQSSASALAVVSVVCAGFILNTSWSLLSALVQVSVNEEQIGTATGIIHVAGRTGGVIGPSIVGSIVTGARISFALILIVSLPYLIYTLLMLFYSEARVHNPFTPKVTRLT